MIQLVISIFLSSVVLANDCGKRKSWWETAIPGSYESRSTTSLNIDTENDYSGIDGEYRHIEEANEPQVYHWNEIYLEQTSPEVIVDPYGGSDDYY